MKSDQGKSILQCVKQYQAKAPKRPKRHSVPEGEPCMPVTWVLSISNVSLDIVVCALQGNSLFTGQAESDQPLSSSADVEVVLTKGYHAEQNFTPPGAQLPHVKTRNFYGRNRQLLIDQRVAHLRANVQQRLRTNTVAPLEHFSLQRHAFAWAAEHELAADLRYS